jgi:hypothetical protein
MSKPVRLSILWEDDAATIREFPSKAEAIDWLATHDTDRPMHSCHIVPVEQRCICRVRGVADLTCPVHGVHGTAPFSDGQE